MEVVEGYVDHIIFRNKENGYSVFILSNEDGELTCVGNFLLLEEGNLLKLTGDYVLHPSYGMQLKVAESEICEPTDKISIERYLASGTIKGIGKTIAKRIVKKFKEETFRIMEEEPERLAEITGISERKAREIGMQVEAKRDVRNATLYLQKYGISVSLGAKIYGKYGNNIYGILEENPYILADDVTGIGFKTADDIAGKVGILKDSDYRVKSGILYVLLHIVQEGNVFAPKEVILNRTKDLLEIEIESIDSYLMDLAIEKKVIIKENGTTNVYPANFYYMETSVAKMLVDLNVEFEIYDTALNQKLIQIEKSGNILLEECQKKAIEAAAKSGVMVLTGGPGTGKTTTINSMINFFISEGMEVLLAAPTGRAAKRMTETTGYEATTIHRLLEVNGNPEEGNKGFNRNEENPLETDVLIIDEMSMVDLPLMNALLKATLPGTRLILVGDRNQLPSVGPGSVFGDVIESGCFNTVTLNKIFRQAEESDIVVNAHKINNGEEVPINNQSKDFFFLKRYNPEVIEQAIVYLVKEKLPRYVEASPFDIQVLAPMKKGPLGVENLNKILQAQLNSEKPGKQEKTFGEKVFREGDKIMQIKNNYQLEWEITTKYGMTIDRGLGIFNGDMGIIKKIESYSETFTVEFDDKRTVIYPFSLLDEIEHAYAVTIHKSQGSEYPAVVIPMIRGPKQLYYRNLLYTAVTRAKLCVTIVGDEKVFYDMIHNRREGMRNTTLSERIKEMS